MPKFSSAPIVSEEALRKIDKWRVESSNLFFISLGTRLALKGIGRIAEISPIAITLSWEPFGTCVVSFADASFAELSSPDKFVAALRFTFPTDEKFALFELLADDDAFPDFIDFD